MQHGILKTLSESMAAVLAASALVLCVPPAVAQSKPAPPEPEKTGAQYCASSKEHVVTLKSMLKSNSGSWSAAMRASVERDIVASEKETAVCCGDLDKCKQAYEAPAKKSTHQTK
jgi:hypothetical protein